MFNHAIALTTASGGGSGGGPSGIETQTVEVPTAEFPTVTSVFTWIDTQGGVREGHILTVSLVGDASYQYQETFDFTDKDYSRVVIQGGAAASGMITNWSTLAGSVGAYTLNIEVPADVVTMASGAGYVLIESGYYPNSEDRAKIYGYWRVQSVVNSTTLKVELPAMDAMTLPVFAANLWRATAFKSMFRNYVNAVPFMRLTRSKGPRLKDVGIVGKIALSGYVASDSHVGIWLSEGSELSLPQDINAALTERGIWVGIHGYTRGIVIESASRLIGSFSVTGCDASGIRVDECSVVSSTQFFATANGRGSAAWGIAITSGGQVIGQAFGARRCTVASGNQGRGLYCLEGAYMDWLVGAAIGNTGNDVETTSCATSIIGPTGSFLLGTVSPAVNTVGNSNAYIRKY
jgi:hypothetical protein